MKTNANIRLVFRSHDSNMHLPLMERTGAITCRISVGEARAKFAVNIKQVARKDWDAKAQQFLTSCPLAAAYNRILIGLRAELTDVHADLERQGHPVTPKAIYKRYMKDNTSPLTLLDVYDLFLKERKPLIGIEISINTFKIAECRFNKLVRFLDSRKNRDMRPEEFRHTVGDQYVHWLLITQGFDHNTAYKYLQSVMQVLLWAVRREHIAVSPMTGYTVKMAAPKDITYLTAEELEDLSCFEFASETLSKARDMFVLQCWTGLAYADVATLNIASCAEHHNGRRLLRIRRSKSTLLKGYEAVIPLMPEAERILAHYDDKPPVFTNQYYNRALKQIGMMCGLLEGKDLTSHIGRKTAGVLFLNAGVPMDVVSKILGHSSIGQTEKVYAKILDKTVLNAVDRVFGSAPTLPMPPPLKSEEGARVIQFRFNA